MVGLYLCGNYAPTLIALYCVDASLFFFLVSVVLGLCCCACQVPTLVQPPPSQGPKQHLYSLCSEGGVLARSVVSAGVGVTKIGGEDIDQFSQSNNFGWNFTTKQNKTKITLDRCN